VRKAPKAAPSPQNATTGLAVQKPATSGKPAHPPKATMLAASGTEAQLQAGVCELLDLLGVLYTVTDAARSWGRDGRPRPSKVAKGWPDLTGCLPGGLMFAIECKGPKGRLKPEQQATIKALVDSGAAVYVAFSLKSVAGWLRNILPAGSRPARKLARLKL